MCSDGTRRAWPLRPAPCLILRHGSFDALDDPVGKHLISKFCGLRGRIRRYLHCLHGSRKHPDLLSSIAKDATFTSSISRCGPGIPDCFRDQASRYGGTPCVRSLSPCRVSSPEWKSTRLNSSHTVISYAVFCLKKKRVNKCRN